MPLKRRSDWATVKHFTYSLKSAMSTACLCFNTMWSPCFRPQLYLCMADTAAFCSPRPCVCPHKDRWLDGERVRHCCMNVCQNELFSLTCCSLWEAQAAFLFNHISVKLLTRLWQCDTLVNAIKRRYAAPAKAPADDCACTGRLRARLQVTAGLFHRKHFDMSQKENHRCS